MKLTEVCVSRVAYLLGAGLAVAALSAVAQAVTAACLLVGFDVLFSFSRIRKCPALFPLHVSAPRHYRGG